MYHVYNTLIAIILAIGIVFYLACSIDAAEENVFKQYVVDNKCVALSFDGKSTLYRCANGTYFTH